MSPKLGAQKLRTHKSYRNIISSYFAEDAIWCKSLCCAYRYKNCDVAVFHEYENLKNQTNCFLWNCFKDENKYLT